MTTSRSVLGGAGLAALGRGGCVAAAWLMPRAAFRPLARREAVAVAVAAGCSAAEAASPSAR